MKRKRGRPKKVFIDPEPFEVGTSKISQEPLHLAYCKRTTITKDKLNELIQQGHVIRRGEWTRVENKRLRKNWRRLCRCQPDFSDPFQVFGVCPRPPNHIIDCDGPVYVEGSNLSFIKLMDKYKVLLRMAYRLPNRLICDINQRCKRMFAYKRFTNHHLKDLPEDVKEAIRKESGSNTYLSEKYDTSPAVIKDIKRKEDPVYEYFRWKDSDDMMLNSCIELIMGNRSPESVSNREISWDRVQREMSTAGYDLTKAQLYHRWYRMRKKQASSNVRRTDHVEHEFSDSS